MVVEGVGERSSGIVVVIVRLYYLKLCRDAHGSFGTSTTIQGTNGGFVGEPQLNYSRCVETGRATIQSFSSKHLHTTLVKMVVYPCCRPFQPISFIVYILYRTQVYANFNFST